MPPAVFLPDAEPLSDVPVVGHGEEGDGVFDIVLFLHYTMIIRNTDKKSKGKLLYKTNFN